MVVRRVHRWEAYGWAPTMEAWWRPDHRSLAETAGPTDLVPSKLYAGHWPEPLALMYMIRDGGKRLIDSAQSGPSRHMCTNRASGK